ncbi:acetolactate synthase-1/2/3 large subunit [Anaerosolibacter carboniphilus]|uniref:Acetolactate synthase-1/2/3 large subunit n=1 Tax=Anaerosolibacter carboniphilus TaxID=1417629 RepID=A0A841KR87_9FIRM|nr:thiamine pyrophosphate-binding protein [Anaerosolibacter carboniphilus]MBB6215937.1 acetolactate synthase-1/2/3 large subunit [Anaerosolibacter carboniphilus]
MTKLAEELIKSLYGLGVRYVFGIPGGPSIPYMEAMRNHGMEFVTVANEQSAGMMADVFGRLTGIPGVCHATFGPGTTNLSTGIGGALLDRSPLIAFTTEVKDEDLGRKVQMNVDHQALLKPITKWTTRLSKDNFKATITNAFQIATAEAPGPVHIGLPVNVAEMDLDADHMINYFEKKSILPPDSLLLAEVKTILEKAKKPILAIGLTAFRHGLHHSIREFLNKNNIPVVLTPMAKGIVPEDHPSYVGVLFHAKSECAASIYRNADLVIGLGYDSIEFNYEAWMPSVPLIHIDTEPVDITPEYNVACEILGNLRDSIAYLNTLELPTYDWNFKEIEDTKLQMFAALMPETKTFTPSDAIGVLQEIMPKDSILTSDVGAHLHLLGQLWKVHEGSRLIMTNGWSTMGFGIPSAIAAKLCSPSSAVACITGDAGFLMNCGELLIARKRKINVVIVVFCDSNLSLIEVKQGWNNVVQYATDLHEGEYFDADKFLGVPVFKAKDKNEMKTSLQRALEVSGPVVIEAVVDGSIYKNLIARNYK